MHLGYYIRSSIALKYCASRLLVFHCQESANTGKNHTRCCSCGHSESAWCATFSISSRCAGNCLAFTSRWANLLQQVRCRHPLRLVDKCEPIPGEDASKLIKGHSCGDMTKLSLDKAANGVCSSHTLLNQLLHGLSLCDDSENLA